MVHIGSIQQGVRVNHPSDLLARNQKVKVKVMSVVGNRLSLSMKDVDQATGRDLTPQLRIKSEAELAEEAANQRGRPATKIREFADDHVNTARRLTSPERWELKQLIASGHAKASDFPDLDDDFTTPAKAEADEELDIEVKDEEAPFLAGQTRRALDLSPVKIVKAPDGSLNRAAVAGASLAKERRELRQQEANETADSETRDLSTPWLDPMKSEADKMFAQDVRGNVMGRKAQDEPAWKKETFNKATSFGKITTMSIQEQRQSLPIYKLKEALVTAMREVSI